MNRQYFVEQEFAKRNIDWDVVDDEILSPECASPEYEEDENAYWDNADEATLEETLEDVCEDVPEESQKKTRTPKKSPERIEKEKQFIATYDAYMHPIQPLTDTQEGVLLDTLYTLLMQLNTGWAYEKARWYSRFFFGVDASIALSVGCTYAYSQLIQDKANGVYSDHPLTHYLRIAQNKAIDKYFRAEFKRLNPQKKTNQEDQSSDIPQTLPARKQPYIVSLDAMQVDRDGRYLGDRNLDISCDPFGKMRRPRWERDDKSRRLSVIYLKKLMNYPNEPQKPLAVMYGSCIFSLAKTMPGNDPLVQKAKTSKVVASKEWAFLKMGKSTLRQLGNESANIVEKYYRAGLCWGALFMEHMEERTADGNAFVWADIIYTQTYTKEQTSDWMESVSKSSVIKAAREVKNDPDLVEYVMETLGPKNKFRKALEKLRKENGR